MLQKHISNQIIKLINADIKSLEGGIKLRHFICAETRAVISFRIYSYIFNNFSRALGYYLYNRSKLKYSFDIHPSTIIGGGMVISHLGGIVIGGHCIIGCNFTINSCVTLGERRAKQGMPVIGSNVSVGTGAKILGNIYIENGTIIAANAVVLNSNYNHNAVLVGIPAKDKSLKHGS